MNRPKLGQHFLHDPNIVRKILHLASPKLTETVLEIGPGRGILTKALAQRVAKVISIELDRNLYQSLETHLINLPNVKLICADALTYPLETLPSPFKVVANLPYYIAIPLIFRLLEFRTQMTHMTLMLQREVAERMVASSGNKKYSPLSIAVQYYTKPRIAFSVSRRCFQPSPRVDSVVAVLAIREKPAVSVTSEHFFFKVVKAGFAHRRKLLKNSLKDSGFPIDVLNKAAALTQLDLSRRAETLSMDEFAQLSDILFEVSPQNMVV